MAYFMVSVDDAETNKKFAEQVATASTRVLGFKMRSKELRKVEPPPTEKTVTRLLSDLKKRDLIRLEGSTLIIRNRTALEAMAV